MYSHKKLNIVFLVPYPHGIAPGQRFRFEQYFHLLEAEQHQFLILPFLNDRAYSLIYKEGHTITKAYSIMLGFFKRFLHLSRVLHADYVFVFRECSPVGPPLFEWIMTKLLRKKIIYDFDDAIWLTDKTNEGRFEKVIRWRHKVKSICRWSYKISCGNDYLANYARQYNSNLVINPTTIDTEGAHKRELYQGTSPLSRSDGGKDQRVVIGWTGSHSTLKYLEAIGPILVSLEKKYDNLLLLVIADKAPQLSLERMTFKKWSKETEVEDLTLLDIGIMPLPDDEWTRGKCGFKALQYMSLGIPAVASPVGVNTKIIEHGVNGFLSKTDEDWFNSLSELIEKKELREKIGNQAIKTVEKHYSVNSNKERFLNLFT